MGEKILILMVGLPRSGKTTWAVRAGFPIVCLDAIRLATYGWRYRSESESLVWAFAELMVRALFFSGHTCVILDATNTTAKHRDVWERMGAHEGFRVEYQVIDTDAETCIERAQSEGNQVIIPVIERMANQFEPLPEDALIHRSSDLNEATERNHDLQQRIQELESALDDALVLLEPELEHISDEDWDIVDRLRAIRGTE